LGDHSPEADQLACFQHSNATVIQCCMGRRLRRMIGRIHVQYSRLCSTFSGTLQEGRQFAAFKTECFSFLPARLSRRAMAGSVRMKPFPDEWPSPLRDVTEGRQLKQKYIHISTYLGRGIRKYLLSDIEHYVLHGRASIYLTRGRLRGCRKHRECHDEML